jgi:hypothetical protein
MAASEPSPSLRQPLQLLGNEVLYLSRPCRLPWSTLAAGSIIAAFQGEPPLE